MKSTRRATVYDTRDLNEDVRDHVHALANTEAFQQSRRERKKVEKTHSGFQAEELPPERQATVHDVSVARTSVILRLHSHPTGRVH
jgi:predicted component of type VI protein secretion system